MGNNRKRKHFDLVQGLLTGRFVEVKNKITGKITQEFSPNVVNKYRPLKELFYLNEKRKTGKIFTYDEFMVKEGIFLPPLDINHDLFAKSKKEKKILKKIKKKRNRILRKNGFDPNKRFNISEPIHIKFIT